MSSLTSYNFTAVSRIYGNVGKAQTITVDPILGDDTRGAVNQSAFLTLGAAITAAAAASPCTIRLAPGVYVGPFVLPAGVVLRGSEIGNTLITATLVDGITLTLTGQNVVSDLTVTAIANASTTGSIITAVQLQGDSSNLVSLENVQITATSSAPSGNIIGFRFTTTAASQMTTIRNVSVRATSTVVGTQALGIYFDGGTNTLTVDRCVATASAPSPTNSYAMVVASTTNLRDSLFSGVKYDIASNGVVAVTWQNTACVNLTSFNAFPITPLTPAAVLQFGVGGQLPPGTFFALPGGAPYSTVEVGTTGVIGFAYRMTVLLRVAPSPTSSTANIVVALMKNGVSQVSTSITGTTATSATVNLNEIPVTFTDRIAVQVTASNDSVAADLQVIIGVI